MKNKIFWQGFHQIVPCSVCMWAAAALFFFPMLRPVCVAFHMTESQKQTAVSVMDEIIQCRFDRARILTDSMIASDSTEPLYWMLALSAAALRQLDNGETSEPDDFSPVYEQSKKMAAAWEKYPVDHRSYMLTMKGFIQLVAAAHTMQRKNYIAGLRLGLSAVSLCGEAKKADSLNSDVDFVLGLYSYARAEIKRKFWGILFWYSGDKQSGIETIRRCSRSAAIVGTTAAMLLQEIYVRENMTDSASRGIERLLERYPLCRFVLWTKAKLLDSQKSFRDAAHVYGALADAYANAPGAFRSHASTRLCEAQRYVWAGDTLRAASACRRLLDACTVASCDQCEEGGRLLKKIAKTR